MSYANFVPKIWAKAIERELERKLVFAEDCNRQYEGDVKQMGDTVKILGVGKPTISKQKGGSIILPDAENVEDTSVEMQINTVAYFNFLVDDIDKRQAVGGLMDALNTEATQELASEMDKDIAALAGTRDAKKLYSDYKAVNADNVLGTLDLALLEKFNANKASALQAMNSAQAELEQRKMAYQMQLEQALQEGIVSAANDRYDALASIGNNYLSKLADMGISMQDAADAAAAVGYTAGNTPQSVSVQQGGGSTGRTNYELVNRLFGQGYTTDDVISSLSAMGYTPKTIQQMLMGAA